MGREGVPVVPPKFISYEMHFTPTNIGFPHNAGIAVQTTSKSFT